MQKNHHLEIDHLFCKEREGLNILQDVMLTIQKGEICGLVGRSGCGKSTLANAICGFYDKSRLQFSGKILFEGINLLGLEEKAYLKIRGSKMSIVFQNALSSLNPLQQVGKQIIESMLIHRVCSRKEAKKRTLKLLHDVEMPNPESVFYAYPHQLSGGMCQRVLIAIALSLNPNFIVMDEPTTALDVTVQARILNLINTLYKKHQFSALFISHDLGVISKICQSVAVMDQGKIVEKGSVEAIFSLPRHPVTKKLLTEIKLLRGVHESYA